jgi:hypothetical protein
MLLECRDCAAIVHAEKLCEYLAFDDDIGPWLFTFLKCPKCHAPLVTSQEDIGFERDGSVIWGEPTRIYPPRDQLLGDAVPESISSPYHEALDCYKAKAYTAAAIMCRKSMEAMCKEHSAKGGLAEGLKHLKDTGIIENRLFEWAEALRISGNEAAHDVASNVSARDARDLLDLTDAILQYVFTFGEKFKNFMDRRQTAGKAVGG